MEYEKPTITHVRSRVAIGCRRAAENITLLKEKHIHGVITISTLQTGPMILDQYEKAGIAYHHFSLNDDGSEEFFQVADKVHTLLVADDKDSTYYITQCGCCSNISSLHDGKCHGG